MLKLNEESPLYGGVSEAECSSGELVGHAGVDSLVIICAVTVLLSGKPEATHGFTTDDEWQPLIVCDVLDLSDYNPPCFLEDVIVTPVRVELRQRFSNTVVFSCEKKVHGDERDVLIDTNVTGFEACSTARHAIIGLGIQRQQLAVEVNEHLQLTFLETSQVMCCLVIGPINRRTIDVVCYFRQSLCVPNFASVIRGDCKTNKLHAALLEFPEKVVFFVD